MGADVTLRVLFVGTANAARSLMAESLLHGLGGGRFRAFSAGMHPATHADAMAFRVLRDNGYPTHRLRPKGWDEFLGPGAPAMDFVVSVCAEVPLESLPVFPGRPVKAHWGVPDPTRADGSDEARRSAYLVTLGVLRRRVQQLTSLPFDSLDRAVLHAPLREIGER